MPAPSYVNALKRKAFELGIGISGTGVRNNFTLADKAKRAADVQHIDVQHIKDWVEVASRLGAPVLRVFCGHTDATGELAASLRRAQSR